MERKIGEVFKFEGRKYKVVERVNKYDLYCDRCAFDEGGDCYPYCYSDVREDGKNVYFVEVKE